MMNTIRKYASMLAAALLVAGVARATPTAPTGTVYRFSVAVDTTGVVAWPSNFWTIANASSITNWHAAFWSVTNGAVRGLTALQPPSTNTLAAAAAHASTAHEVTDSGGFQAGTGATAQGYGAAVGECAATFHGGAVGYSAWASGFGGAVGAYALTSDGFAGGLNAWATDDGTITGTPIDAIQLGTGGNSETNTLQVYNNRLLNADGTIPVERFVATINVSNAADRAYTDAVAKTNVNAHAQVAAGTNTLGHVSNIGFSYANQLLYYTAPQNCTGMVFRFYTPAGTATNIYLWRDQP